MAFGDRALEAALLLARSVAVSVPLRYQQAVGRYGSGEGPSPFTLLDLTLPLTFFTLDFTLDFAGEERALHPLLRCVK